MSAPFIIPFNFQPTGIATLTSAGYTVPAGKYGRLNYRLRLGNLMVNSLIIDSAYHVPNATLASGSTATLGTGEILLYTTPLSLVGNITLNFSTPATAATFTS
jgi:hypothetical protein